MNSILVEYLFEISVSFLLRDYKVYLRLVTQSKYECLAIIYMINDDISWVPIAKYVTHALNMLFIV